RHRKASMNTYTKMAGGGTQGRGHRKLPDGHFVMKDTRIERMAMTGIPGRTGSPVRARESTSGRERASESRQPVKGKSAGLLHLLKEAWPFLRPQRMLLFLGLVLMAINRLAGLVLPASTKFLVDNVVGKHQVHLLAPLALAI